MTTYSVLFQICGKKMKKQVEAKSKKEAEQMIRNELKIDKITDEDLKDGWDILNQILKNR